MIFTPLVGRIFDPETPIYNALLEERIEAELAAFPIRWVLGVDDKLWAQCPVVPAEPRR